MGDNKVEGYPGLYRLGQWWHVSMIRQGVALRGMLDVTTEEAAKALYAQMEQDPDAWSRKLKHIRARRASRGLTLSDALRGCLRSRAHRGVRIGEVKTAVEALITQLGPRKRPAEVTPGDIDAWIDKLRAHGLAPNTLARRHTDVASFFSYCLRIGLVDENPAAKANRPPWQQAAIHTRRLVEPDEIRRVVAAFKIDWPRRYAIILWSLGLRPEELMRIRPRHYDVNMGELTVDTAKGGKVRKIPVVDQATSAALVEHILWAEKRRFKIPNRFQFGRNLALTCKRAGVELFTAKALRHSRITIWLREGCSPLDVMRWAGHSNIMMTMEYVEESKRVVKMPAATDWGLPDQQADAETGPEGETGDEDPKTRFLP